MCQIASTIDRHYCYFFVLLFLNYVDLHDWELQIIVDSFPGLGSEQVLRDSASLVPNKEAALADL